VSVSRGLRRESGQDRAHRGCKLGSRRCHRAGLRPNEVAGPTLQQIGVLRRRRAQPSAQAIAHHRVSDRSSHRVRDAGRFVTGGEHHGSHLEISGRTPATARQRPKRCLITDAPDQAERLERPLLRRRRMTARPARLRIRSRKPCFFLRFRLFGWYVRFTHGLLERPGRGGAAGRGAQHVVELARKWTAESTGRFQKRAIEVGNGPMLAFGPSDDRRPADLALAGTLSGLGITSRSLDGLPRPRGERFPGVSRRGVRADGTTEHRGSSPTARRPGLLHTCGHCCGQSGSRYGHSSGG
jgi:hypothetical protein